MSDTGYPDFINREKQQLLKEAAEMEISCKRIIELADKVIDGRGITRAEAMELIRTSDADTLVLLAMADKIRQKFRGNGIDFCAIVNARSGHCPENGRFCAQ